LLSDGTCVVLYALRGDLKSAKGVLTEQSTVIRFGLTGSKQAEAAIHFHPNEKVVELLTILQEYEVILKTPVQCVTDGVRISVVGWDDTLRDAVEEIPDDLSITLESIQEYSPNEGPLSELTARQRDILEAADERGYYDFPRRISHEGLADELDISVSTVSEHLRKAESKLIKSLLAT
jgi:predicted DNA binding protein